MSTINAEVIKSEEAFQNDFKGNGGRIISTAPSAALKKLGVGTYNGTYTGSWERNVVTAGPQSENAGVEFLSYLVIMTVKKGTAETTVRVNADWSDVKRMQANSTYKVEIGESSKKAKDGTPYFNGKVIL